MAEPDKRPVTLEELLALNLAMGRCKGQRSIYPAEAAMKVIVIILMLLIPTWCYADGNELFKRCGLFVSYIDSDEPDVFLSGEMMFCSGFNAGHNEYEFTLSAGSQIECRILSSRMRNFK